MLLLLRSYYYVTLSKFQDLRLISLNCTTMGSQIRAQKYVARRQPITSPKIQAQQFCKLYHWFCEAYWIDRAMVMAGLIARPAKGANDLAMKQNTAMLRQPVSSLYMKVVFGLESKSRNRIKMNTPIPSFDITLKTQIFQSLNTSQGSILRPISSLTNNPATAPDSCASKYQGKRFHLQRFYFFMQLDRVIIGLRFAPVRGAAIKMAMSVDEAACASSQQSITALQQPQVKINTPINSKTKSWEGFASFMILYLLLSK